MGNYFKGVWESLEKNGGNRARFSTLGSNIVLFDLGSSGGTPPPFCWILENIKLVNFDPDRRLASEAGGINRQVAIGPSHMDKLYLNKRPTTSSLLPANLELTNRYDFKRLFNFDNIFDTESIQEVTTYGLDEIIELEKLPRPDFIKIDVQGLTQEVLETAEQCLNKSVLGMQIEVEFLETYKSQKTFGVTHEYLQERGFEIFQLSNLNKWFYKSHLDLKSSGGQHAFCDLLYLKSIDSIENQPEFWTEERAIKFTKIALLYDLTDVAAAFFEKFHRTRLLSETESLNLQELIESWESGLKYLYHYPNRTFFNTLMDISPRKIYHKLKRVLGK